MKKRLVNKIVLHCSASDVSWQDSIDSVRDLHVAPKDQAFRWGDYKTFGKAWKDVGYHFYIRRDGEVEVGRDEQEIGAHCYGHNANSIGICLGGNVFKDFHSPQFNAARDLVLRLLKKYGLRPEDVYLHTNLDPHKSCPNFTLDQFWIE